MHKFACYSLDGRPLPPELQGAHLLGTDNVPVRGEISRCESEIRCAARTSDPVALSLLWPVPDYGMVQLQTTRLPPRDRPYHLHLELARHLLMRISVKREEWGLFDFPGMDEIAERIDTARDAFIRGLQNIDDPPAAARWADEALTVGLDAAEKMSAFHAGVFLGRRQQTGGFARPFLGAALPAAGFDQPAALKAVAELVDFVRVPMVWREIQPTEQGLQFDRVDATLKAATAAKLGLRGGPLLMFGVRSVPDWMYIWENDFEAIYDAAREHVQRIVQRYAKTITSWVVVSGLHADSVFGFTFEQIMELTRMAASVTKQVAPRSQVLIELCQPWGEYYARNQQTIPPLLYADMIVQSGVSFDGFGLQLLFGAGAEGYQLRDPLQVSALIDKLANLGKPLHVTALGAPSGTRAANPAAAGGQWHAPWSDTVQADWLVTLAEIALSKPYVETVCFQPLTDASDDVIAEGGLLRPNLTPKPAFTRLHEWRRKLVAGAAK